MHEIMSTERRFSTPSRVKSHTQHTHDDQELNQSHSLTLGRAKTSHVVGDRLLNRQRVENNDLETQNETKNDMDKHIEGFLARNNLNRRRKSLLPLVYDGTTLRQQNKTDIAMVTKNNEDSRGVSEQNHDGLLMSSGQYSPGIPRTRVPIPPGMSKRSMSIGTTELGLHKQQQQSYSQRTGVTNLPGHSKRSMSIHVTENNHQNHFGRRLSHRGSLNPVQQGHCTDIMPHAPNKLPFSYYRQRESDRRRSLTDPEWARRRLSQPAACFRQRESDRRLSFTDPELTQRRMTQHDVFADPEYNPFLSRKFGHAGSAENSIKPIRRLSRDNPCLSPNCIHCRPGRTRLSDLSGTLDKDIAEGEAGDESVSSLEVQFRELKHCRYLRVPHNSSEDEEG